MTTTHKGACFCGSIEIEVSGTPEGMGYCHCASCRAWSAGPVNAFSLWKPDGVRITRGQDLLGEYASAPNSKRRFCRNCGGHLMTDHPEWGVTDVFAAVIPSLAFEPGLHVNYAETVLPMRDGLPKFRDFPAEIGGSGEQVPE
ncbi:GFA family protein [Paracoccus methylarcula]|uniref:GFA family protein n=1 Tax=Paracoccus methylarcula TaxID=72022 RepID=A0A3R7Q1S8_9RHOB|nr:GFA family protein [Paracoccus methylarcula]RNF33919.1 GFA family protein [Paracoccus methylarcula]